MPTKNSNQQSIGKSKELSVATAAAKLFGGDESQVWASIIAGKIQASVLIEPDTGLGFSEPLRAELARKFMAGTAEYEETRNLLIPPIPAGIGLLKVKLTHNVKCVSRRASVLLTIDTETEVLAASIWPWGTYETELLRVLAAATRKFWVNYDPADPSTAETNQTVAIWINATYGISMTRSFLIAKILHVDDLRSGPRH